MYPLPLLPCISSCCFHPTLPIQLCHNHLCCTKPDNTPHASTTNLAGLLHFAFSISVFLSPHWFSVLLGTTFPAPIKHVATQLFTPNCYLAAPKGSLTLLFIPQHQCICLDYKTATSLFSCLSRFASLQNSDWKQRACLVLVVFVLRQLASMSLQNSEKLTEILDRFDTLLDQFHSLAAVTFQYEY